MEIIRVSGRTWVIERQLLRSFLSNVIVRPCYISSSHDFIFEDKPVFISPDITHVYSAPGHQGKDFSSSMAKFFVF